MESPGTFFLKIHDNPLVFSLASCGRRSGGFLEAGFALSVKEAQGRPFYAVVAAYHWIPFLIPEIRELADRASEEHPEATIIVLCPTQTDTNLVKNAGLEALHVHHNAFIDETIFRPDEEATKHFGAVHNARLVNEKRHHLAWGVPKIAVLATPSPHSLEEQLENLRGYQDLSYSNLSLDGKYQWLPPEEVRDVLCQSACGIILSEIEGGNFASGEYLLCGLPVISTPSKGGRDEFFRPEFVKIVAPEPEAIEAAVAEVQEANFDPVEIREVTLRHMLEHRFRFIRWLTEIGATNALDEASTRGWLPLFRHQLRDFVGVSKPGIDWSATESTEK